ncbi:hypothetical protein AMD00_05255 [Viridibacillus arvi]|uniref:PTS EIIB type-1 domain-containing protein n=1 Tax=Viridibacillus arvi TaxID=263475 RepID=A0A0M0LMA5_9BACL|nr:hypothetical protein AMD00_05255 [Viridibacillus arvi]
MKTPGREDDEDVEIDEVGDTTSGNKFSDMASKIYDALGGAKNVTSVDHCATRLRVEVKNMDVVDQKKIKATGVPGINVVGPKSIKVIVGTNVQFVADEIEKIRK